jgi:hypothetical protein
MFLNLHWTSFQKYENTIAHYQISYIE